jgi:hypothetical protein
MGLFGKKREDEPEESNGHTEPPVKAAPPPPAPVEVPSRKGYGIDELVALMRRLPSDNVELVVRVLKETLESVKIPLPGLIKDSEKREQELTHGIDENKKAITTLEEELAAKQKAIEEAIAAKRKKIAELEAAHKEVTLVKDRLNLGLKLDQVTVTPVMAPPPPPVAAKPPPPPPPPAEKDHL